MFVCECRWVKARTIDKAIKSGARTVEEVGRKCGAGTECGACRPDIEAMLTKRGIYVAPPAA
ncbi:MAG: bacterioferritin-associated ferredoxin [Acidimicrobiia bacterium]